MNGTIAILETKVAGSTPVRGLVADVTIMTDCSVRVIIIIIIIIIIIQRHLENT